MLCLLLLLNQPKNIKNKFIQFSYRHFNLNLKIGKIFVRQNIDRLVILL